MKWLFGVAPVVTVAIAALIAHSPRPMSQEYSKDRGYFYRVRAGFEVKDSGEPLNFDYVVACNIRLTRWRDGGLSNNSTLQSACHGNGDAPGPRRHAADVEVRKTHLRR